MKLYVQHHHMVTVCHTSGQLEVPALSVTYPIVNGPPEPAGAPFQMDWLVIIVPIVYGLAGLIITSLFMDWPDLYYTCCRPTGQSDNNLVVHGLAGPVLYPSLTSWPAVGCSPLLGLHDTIWD
jgi:hypothetical protein